MPTVTVVGAPDLAARLAVPVSEPSDRRVVVVGGPVDARVGRATEAVRSGADVLLLWPPARVASEATALAARAEEAGVEIGVARPLGGSTALADLPWAARLVMLTIVARTDARLAAAGWRTLLAGALDVLTSLADARGATRLDAVAERDDGAIRAVALAARFENGAYGQATVRFSDQAPADTLTLYASRPGARIDAHSLAVPLGDDAEHAVALDPEVAEVDAFVRTVAANRRPPQSLDRALDTLRLTQRVEQALQ